jgi:hypothetical protein
VTAREEDRRERARRIVAEVLGRLDARKAERERQDEQLQLPLDAPGRS